MPVIGGDKHPALFIIALTEETFKNLINISQSKDNARNKY